MLNSKKAGASFRKDAGTKASLPTTMTLTYGFLARFAAGIILAAACTAAAFLGFVSAPLALGVLCAGCGAAYAARLLRTRALWENAVSFQVKNIAGETKTLGRAVADLRRAQNSLEAEIARLPRKTETPAAAPGPKPQPESRFGSARSPLRYRDLMTRTPQPVAAAALAEARPLTSATSNARLSPLATRPGQRDKRPPLSSSELRRDPEDKPRLSKSLRQTLLHSALREGRVDLFVQPIVRLPQRKTRFYEVFARIRAGAGFYLDAQDYMDIAQEENLLPAIDDLLLMDSLAIIQRSAYIERAAPFFINITQQTLCNAAYMKRLLGFVSHHRDLAPRLVFEMRQIDMETLSGPVTEIMRGLARLGCCFSMDQVYNRDLDTARLKSLGFRYLKIPAAMFLKALERDIDFVSLKRVVMQMESNGIGVIAEKIENEKVMKRLLDYDLYYGQGYLFGRPELQGAYRQGKAA